MTNFDDEKKRDDDLAKIRSREGEDLAKALSEKSGIPYVNLSFFPINIDALRAIDEETARKIRVAPFNIVGKRVSVGALAPQNDEVKMLEEEMTRKGFVVEMYMVSEQSLKRVWDRYEELSHATTSTAGSIIISEENINRLREEIKSIVNVTNLIAKLVSSTESNRLTKIMEVILAGALSLKASDIHLEPTETQVRLRYRLDGVLTDMSMFDLRTYSLVLSRIKLISGMKVNIQGAQDGRFSIKIGEVEIEIRTSIVPSTYDDSVVMRVLDPASISVDLEKLGIHKKLLDILIREMNKPNGMILTTGPTGSGKTTSLYAFLKKKYDPEIKIITIENPIEYHMKGIVQTQTDENKNYTFASGLKAALRQDPDVIMVGEIRDNETASIAINSALTGHIVFSTLHTNNAAGTYPRLIDLGISPKVLTSALTVSMAQRLVRKLCSECKKEVPVTGNERTIIDRILGTIGDKSYLEGIQTEKHFIASGCDKCNNTGYKGRTGVYEAILSDKAIEDTVMNYPSEREIWNAAKPQNILNMKQDAILKILRGETSFDEVGRVVDLETDY